jgi:hypothetical protein
MQHQKNFLQDFTEAVAEAAVVMAIAILEIAQQVDVAAVVAVNF